MSHSCEGGVKVGACMLFFLLCSLAAAQSKSWSTFKDSRNGVSFRYPTSWARMEAYGAVLATKNRDRDVVAFSMVLDGGTKRAPVVQTTSFVYSILWEADAISCRKRAEIPSDQEPPRGPDSLVINGLQFAHGSAMSAGAGHGTESDAYTIFQNGRCYGFEIVRDTGYIDHLKSRGADVDPALILKAVHIKSLDDNPQIQPTVTPNRDSCARIRNHIGSERELP